MRRLAEHPVMRLARLYAFGILASFGLLVLVRSDVGPRGLTSLVAAALRSASIVVAALSAWASAGDFDGEDRRNGVRLLSGLHGVDARELEYARSVAAAMRATTGIALPALGVTALGALTSGALAWALASTVSVLLYAAALGATLALLSRSAALLAGPGGRLLLVCLVAALELGHRAIPAVPSITSAFGGCLSAVERIGRSFA